MRKLLMSLAMAVGSLLFAQDEVVHLSGFEWAYMDYGDGVCITYAAMLEDTTLDLDYTLTLPETLGGKPVVAIVTEALAGGYNNPFYNNPFCEDNNPNWNYVTRIVFPKTLTSLISFDWGTETFTDSYPTSPLGTQLYDPWSDEEPMRTKPITLAFQGPALENLECPPWYSVEYGEDYWDALYLETPHLLELPTDATYRQQWESAITRKTLVLKEGEDEVTWNGLKVKDFVPNLDETIEEIADYFTECKASTDAVGGKICDALVTLIKLQGNEALRKVATDTGFLKVNSAGVWTVSSFDIEKLDTQPQTVINALVSSSVLGEFEKAIELLEAVTPTWGGCVVLKPADVLPLQDTLYIDAADALLMKTSLQVLVSKLMLLSSYKLTWDFAQPIVPPRLKMGKISTVDSLEGSGAFIAERWNSCPTLEMTDDYSGLTFLVQVADVDGDLVFRITAKDFPDFFADGYEISYFNLDLEWSDVFYQNQNNGKTFEVFDGRLWFIYQGCASLYEDAMDELDEDGISLAISWSNSLYNGYFSLMAPSILPYATIFDSQKEFLNGRVEGVDLVTAKAYLINAATTFQLALTALEARTDAVENLFNLDASVTASDIAFAKEHALNLETSFQTKITHLDADYLIKLAPLFSYDGPDRSNFPKIENGEFVSGTEKDSTYCGIIEKIESLLRLTLIANEGGIISGVTSGSYPVGTEVVVVAEPNDGYNFTGWNGDQMSAENPLSFVLESDTTITASFASFGRLDSEIAADNDLKTWLTSVVLKGESGILELDSNTSVETLNAARLLGVKPSVESTDGTITVSVETRFEVTSLKVENDFVYLTIKVTVDEGSLLSDTIKLGGDLTINVKNKLTDKWSATPIEFNPDEMVFTRVTDSNNADLEAYEINLKIDVSDHKFYQVIVE